MKFIHRASLYMTPAQRAEIEALGIKPPAGTKLADETPLVAFDVAEDHPNWQLLCVLLRQWGEIPRLVHTEFTPLEIESARWLQLHAWPQGFPQPQDIDKYVQIVYDLSHWCPTCCYGKVQNAPFRMKSEPRWGRRGMMSLIWVHDEFFVLPAIWETVFKPFGIKCRPVANRKGIELQTVVQLVVEEEVDIVTEGLKPLPCETCGRIRYEWRIRGPFPALVQEPTAAMAKTRQALGEGWSMRAVFVSQELARALQAHNVRGASFTPVDAAIPAFVA